MLVIFYGVSCVGKTSIIRKLSEKYGWEIITTYMTRQEREGEFEKKQVSLEEMKYLEKNNFFLCVNNLPSGIYGTPKNEIEYACKTRNKVWCMDFPISQRQVFDNLNYIGIVILPESIKQLQKQIQISGRNDRKTFIINDYKTNYLNNSFRGLQIIINKPNNIDYTCNEIYEIIKNKDL